MSLTVYIPTILCTALLSSCLSVEVNVFAQPSMPVNENQTTWLMYAYIRSRPTSAKLPFVTWIKIINVDTNHTIALYEYGNGIINENYREKISIDESGNLYLNKVTRADGGIYICEVEITDDQPKIDSGIVNVTVLYIDAPTIHVPTNVVDGNMLKIVCYSGAAKPNPKLIIYKNHQSIVSRIDATLSYITNNVTLEDSGNYFCSASNDAGSKNSDTKRLNVQYIAENISFSSTVSQNMLSIRCEVNADPSPKYTLYQDNKAIKSEIGDVMEYNIDNVKLQDAGNYYCMATNIVGIVKSETLSFSVACTYMIGRTPFNTRLIAVNRD
ncbi:hemicentin-1-like [Anneissia japonica]|uniref:hemicentin-1-like n=1 Tax=Anneissia japonica TaxID=1529436 RepID=UPI0014254C29|nr:hemicentin-1-like [Anneissia japonica]